MTEEQAASMWLGGPVRDKGGYYIGFELQYGPDGKRLPKRRFFRTRMKWNTLRGWWWHKRHPIPEPVCCPCCGQEVEA